MMLISYLFLALSIITFAPIAQTQTIVLGNSSCSSTLSTTFDADSLATRDPANTSLAFCLPYRSCTLASIPAEVNNCNSTCQEYFDAFYCGVQQGCLDTCEYKTNAGQLFVCQSALTRLVDACVDCTLYNKTSADGLASLAGVGIVDDLPYPVSRTCAFPGCKCSSNASCPGGCQPTAVGCINPYFTITPPSEVFCFDFLEGLTDPVDVNFSATSSMQFRYVLAQVCEAFNATDFVNLVVGFTGVDARSLDVNTTCGSVVATMRCLSFSVEAANILCQALDIIIRNQTELNAALRVENIASPEERDDSDDWLWSVFVLLVLAFLLCICCIFLMLARRKAKAYTHYESDADRQAATYDDVLHTTLHPAGQPVPFWQLYTRPQDPVQEEPGSILPFEKNVSRHSHAVSESYLPTTGTKWYDTETGVQEL